MDSSYYKRISKWAPDLKGVFTLSDLRIIFSELSEPALFKNVREAVKDKTLEKVVRGIYAVPGVSLDIISYRINPESYISTGTVLARHALIGSVPARRVQSIKIGRPRTYALSTGFIEHLSIRPEFYFGFEMVDGIKYATPEKAFLDVCYYLFKGKRFSFNPSSDVDIRRLKPAILNEYLKPYDKRFLNFFNSILKS